MSYLPPKHVIIHLVPNTEECAPEWKYLFAIWNVSVGGMKQWKQPLNPTGLKQILISYSNLSVQPRTRINEIHLVTSVCDQMAKKETSESASGCSMFQSKGDSWALFFFGHSGFLQEHLIYLNLVSFSGTREMVQGGNATLQCGWPRFNSWYHCDPYWSGRKE